MLVLFETPAGYALFSLKNEGKLEDVNNLYKEFETPEKANKMVKLKAFSKFENTAEALSAATAIVDGKLSKGLKTFLKDELASKDVKDTLAVAETKLGGLIKEKLGIQCVYDNAVNELFRGIRGQLTNLLTGLPESEMSAMVLGLSHSLSRYKLKFSPDKVDTMIIQAIALLDDLDKELNTYAMRVKEWYGWHFPEMGKVIVDNVAYSKTIRAIGMRNNASNVDLSGILPEELEKEVKELAEISMGTEISDQDIENIGYLCDQIISISEYRTQLYDYLKNRMQAIAPNLTAMVGELVGARLIAHAGSLMNLAKHPASTVQILGAEKALFRALKTKHDTPKYGLIYHASLIGQAPQKLKGKISRVLAAKAALSIRVDALGDKDTIEIGTEARLKVEARLRSLEGKSRQSLSGSGKGKAPQQKYSGPNGGAVASYNSGADFVAAKTVEGGATPKKQKKEKSSTAPSTPAAAAPAPVAEAKSEKKLKRKQADVEEEAAAAEPAEPVSEKKKKKKAKTSNDE